MAASNHHRRNPLLRTAQPRSAVSGSPVETTRSTSDGTQSVLAQQEHRSSVPTQTDTNHVRSAPPALPDPPTEAEIFYPSPRPPSLPETFIPGIEDTQNEIAWEEDAADIQKPDASISAESEEDLWIDPAETPGGIKLSPLSLGIRVLFDLLLIGAALFVLQRPDPQPIALHPPPTAAPTATATAVPTPGPITVFVSGAVREPALYRVPPDARVADAIAMAGGLIDSANADLLNQAEPLFDGAQVHVPIHELHLQSATAPGAAASGAAVSGAAASGVDAPGGSVQTVGALTQPWAGVSGNAPQTAGAVGTNGLININTASVDALTSLPGIGPSKAANIVAGRPYATVDELERASGIGPKTVDQLRDLVTVQ